jgi:endonuclease III
MAKKASGELLKQTKKTGKTGLAKAAKSKPAVAKPATAKTVKIAVDELAKKAPKVTVKSASKTTTEQAKQSKSDKANSGKSGKASVRTTAKNTQGTPQSVGSGKEKNKTLRSAGAGKEKQGAAAVMEKNVQLVSKNTAAEVMRLLCKTYPDAQCELTFKNDFELLIAVILSAQTTDVQVNKVTPKLFEKFPTARALAEADIEDVKEIVKPTGYYNNKAKIIQACAQSLVTNFGSKVPNNLDELVRLPGVGRKTANVVLGVIHKIPGWAVDTHVQRLSKRLGFTTNEDPLKIEVDLQNLFPNSDWSLYGITLIFHGRRLCFARNPDCPNCPVNHLCPSSLV